MRLYASGSISRVVCALISGASLAIPLVAWSWLDSTGGPAWLVLLIAALPVVSGGVMAYLIAPYVADSISQDD